MTVHMPLVTEDQKKEWLIKAVPLSIWISNRTPMHPQVVLAQLTLESAWGTSLLATKDHNYAGIKYRQTTVLELSDEDQRLVSGTTYKAQDGDVGFISCANDLIFGKVYYKTINHMPYLYVRAAFDHGSAAQAKALGLSPWSAGHYTNIKGFPVGQNSEGSKLISLMLALKSQMESLMFFSFYD